MTRSDAARREQIRADREAHLAEIAEQRDAWRAELLAAGHEHDIEHLGIGDVVFTAPDAAGRSLSGVVADLRYDEDGRPEQVGFLARYRSGVAATPGAGRCIACGRLDGGVWRIRRQVRDRADIAEVHPLAGGSVAWQRARECWSVLGADTRDGTTSDLDVGRLAIAIIERSMRPPEAR